MEELRTRTGALSLEPRPFVCVVCNKPGMSPSRLAKTHDGECRRLYNQIEHKKCSQRRAARRKKAAAKAKDQ